jgi:hypothetical protein
MNRGASRLVLLMLALVSYAILSTGLVTRLSKQVYFSSSHSESTFAPPPIEKSRAADDWLQKGNPHSKTANRMPHSNDFICDAQDAPAFLPKTHLTRRALHGIIIGAQKGGTQALQQILLTHPKILTSGFGHGELHFFNRLYRKEGHSTNTILRQDIRDAFVEIVEYRGVAERRGDEMDISSEKSKQKVGIHSAPIYLFSGRIIPARVLCASPWTKVMVVLRNPIDRAYSHYNFIKNWKSLPTYLGKKPSFDKFVEDDVELLKHYGVVRDWNTTNFDSFAGSDEEYQAWEQYVSFVKMRGPVGRGLYAIQLEIWMDEFRKHNKSIDDDLLVLQSESTKDDPKESYEQAVQFLGLKPRANKRHHRTISMNHHATNYTDSGISESTYQMLYKLYKPYNQRLYNLLGSEEWGGAWDDLNGDE